MSQDKKYSHFPIWLQVLMGIMIASVLALTLSVTNPNFRQSETLMALSAFSFVVVLIGYLVLSCFVIYHAKFPEKFEEYYIPKPMFDNQLKDSSKD